MSMKWKTFNKKTIRNFKKSSNFMLVKWKRFN